MLSLQDWCCCNKRLLNEIDVRRIVAYVFFREDKTAYGDSFSIFLKGGILLNRA
mgnify:CR=1 FL=1